MLRHTPGPSAAQTWPQAVRALCLNPISNVQEAVNNQAGLLVRFIQGTDNPRSIIHGSRSTVSPHDAASHHRQLTETRQQRAAERHPVPAAHDEELPLALEGKKKGRWDAMLVHLLCCAVLCCALRWRLWLPACIHCMARQTQTDVHFVQTCPSYDARHSKVCWRLPVVLRTLYTYYLPDASALLRHGCAQPSVTSAPGKLPPLLRSGFVTRPERLSAARTCFLCGCLVGPFGPLWAAYWYSH